MDREQKGRAWLAWQLGLLPRVDPKKYPTWAEFSGGAAVEKRAQTAAEIDIVMRRWMFAMAAVEAAAPNSR